MAAAVALTAFAGFAPTYFLKTAYGAPELPLLLHVHGMLFTAWVLLFVAQVSLVATGRTRVHRRLGVISLGLVPAMLVAGFLAAARSAHNGFTPPGGPPPLVFLVIPIGALVVFASLFGAAMIYRRQSDTHKRLMLLATISLLTPALARLWFVRGGGPPLALGLTDLFVLACLVYDWTTRGRVHPAFVWGSAFFLASQPLRIAVGHTDAWLAFAGWLAR